MSQSINDKQQRPSWAYPDLTPCLFLVNALGLEKGQELFRYAYSSTPSAEKEDAVLRKRQPGCSGGYARCIKESCQDNRPSPLYLIIDTDQLYMQQRALARSVHHH